MKLQTLKPRLQTIKSRVGVMQPGSWRTDKQSSNDRGYTYQWRKARAGYLAKHPFCVYCLRNAGIVARDMAAVILECAEKRVPLPYADVLDHIAPHRGDKTLFWDRKNWQGLCNTHHSGQKQREEAQQY